MRIHREGVCFFFRDKSARDGAGKATVLYLRQRSRKQPASGHGDWDGEHREITCSRKVRSQMFCLKAEFHSLGVQHLYSLGILGKYIGF